MFPDQPQAASAFSDHQKPRPLFSSFHQRFEEIVDKFEEAWCRGSRPNLETLLPSDDATLRDQLLRELSVVELECRLKLGEEARVEEYLNRFPELRSEPDLCLELILTELAYRSRRESLNIEEYASRFPDLADEIKRRAEDRIAFGKQSVFCPQCFSPVRIRSTAGGKIACVRCGESFYRAQPHSLRGSLSVNSTFGKFELLELAGQGAFGTVYRARDRELERDVAVKVPRSGLLFERADEERFLREARSIAQLSHHGIVPVFEAGRIEETPFIATEYIRGKTLAELLGERRLPYREAAELVRRIAEALDYAHLRGVIHRDVKPSNIMLDESQDMSGDKHIPESAGRFGVFSQDDINLRCQPRLMDFGLAAQRMPEATITMEGKVLGTPAYMSPEQAAGKSALVDRRSDVYSLGVVLYELLTGELPFRGNIRLVLQQVLGDDPRPIRQLNDRVPRDLETVCLKCMEKDPRRRYQTAGQLADELQRFLTTRPITARSIGTWVRFSRWCRRRPAIALLSMGLVTAICIGFGAVVWGLFVSLDAARERTVAELEKLQTASWEVVPELLDGLAPYIDHVETQLENDLHDERIDESGKTRIRLALLPTDSSHARSLFETMLGAEMREFIVIRDRLELAIFADQLRERLQDHEQPESVRFRAACALAAVKPVPIIELMKHGRFIARRLVSEALENPSDFDILLRALTPLRDELLQPLRSISDDKDNLQALRHKATQVLSTYLEDSPEELAQLLLNSEPWQFVVVMDKFKSVDNAAAVDQLSRVLHGPYDESLNPEQQDGDAKRLANAAIALVLLRDSQEAWQVLALREDPTARSYIIDRYIASGGTFTPVVRQLNAERDTQLRRALLLILGKFAYDDIPDGPREELLYKLRHFYQHDPDPGVHSASRWVLTQWNLLPQLQQATKTDQRLLITSPSGPSIYKTTQGQTMFILQRDGDQRDFAIAMCEITIAQYRRFDPTWEGDEDDCQEGQCPAYFVSWQTAASYCNWLSATEGIPEDHWCYVEYDGLLKTATNSLDRTGYRLPTDDEWSYACQAGAKTTRFFGWTDELLTRYAWCPNNSPEGKKHPVGLLIPNDFGLFDTYGNVDEISHDVITLQERNAAGQIVESHYAVTRGGAAGDVTMPLGNRVPIKLDNPWQGDLAMGFRVARTIVDSTE